MKKIIFKVTDQNFPRQFVYGYFSGHGQTFFIQRKLFIQANCFEEASYIQYLFFKLKTRSMSFGKHHREAFIDSTGNAIIM